MGTLSRFIDSNHNRHLRVIDSVGSKTVWRHLYVQLSHTKQVRVPLLTRVALILQVCITSNCVVCSSGSYSRAYTTHISPQKSKTDKTRLEIQDWLQIPSIPSNTVIDKNEDGSDVTQDVDVLVWWRDVGHARFPRIFVMTRQFLTVGTSSIPFGRGDLHIKTCYRSMVTTGDPVLK